MSEFDGSKIAEGAAQRTIDKILDDLYSPTKEKIAVQRIKLRETFEAYFKSNFERCSQIRTIDQSAGARNLAEIFVDLRLKSRRDPIRSHELFAKICGGSRCIITGKGGSGKSVLFKYFFLKHFVDDLGRIPLLIELRRFESSRHRTLMNLCEDTLLLQSSLPSGVFKSLCGEGYFDFFFDGFDELKRSDKDAIESELLDLARRFPRCGVAVSGRDNRKFSTWEGFEDHIICDLNLDEIKSIVRTTTYDKATKERFITEIERGTLTDRMQLLATPLLANLFIMTYANYGEIPRNLSGFYSRAFDTLAARHDSTKEAFKRDLCLVPDAWRTLFGIFCLISYIRMTYKFDESELKNFVREAVTYASSLHSLREVHAISIDDLCDDLWEGINILVRDYGAFQFIHRNFQEYFAAECVSRTINSDTRSILGEFASRDTDSTFSMAFEINEERVTDEFLLPGIADFKRGLCRNEEELADGIFFLLEPKISVISYSKYKGLPGKLWCFQNTEIRNFLLGAASLSSLSARFRAWELEAEKLCIEMAPIIPANKISPLGSTYEVSWTATGSLEFLMSVELADGPFEERLRDHLQVRSKKMLMNLRRQFDDLFPVLISRVDEVIVSREKRRLSMSYLLGLNRS
jgi:hypothetical protein